MSDYPKLVRDHIPEICAAKGARETFRPVADIAELGRMLDAKLDEELAEWRDGNDPAELADLLDVVRAVAIHHGIGWEQLQQLADDKRDRCGDLLDGVIWTGPDPTSEPDPVAGLMEALDQTVAGAEAARERHRDAAVQIVGGQGVTLRTIGRKGVIIDDDGDHLHVLLDDMVIPLIYERHEVQRIPDITEAQSGTTSIMSGDMAVELPGIEPDKVVDLMEALEQSVAAAKAAYKRHPQPRTDR